MARKPYLSVIIPVYNEATRLPLTLVDVDRHLSKAKYSYEIIVVDDGSVDDTVEVAKKLSKLVDNLRVVSYEKNQGKGFAVKTGMLEATGKYRLFMDGDNSTSVDHFNKMVPHFKDGYDIVICSRDIKGSELHPPQPWFRRILGNLGNIYIQILLVWGIWDTQCGFKCFTEKAAKQVFNLQKIKGFGFDVEILALGRRSGLKIKQIPVFWVNDTNSRVSLGSYIQVLIDTLRVRIWLWRGKYDLK